MSTQLPTHKHQEVMKQWAEGKIIQYRDPCTDRWVTTKPFEHLAWMSHFDYRVKPESQKFRIALVKSSYAKQLPYPVICDFDTKEHEEIEKDIFFIRWLTDWEEYDAE
jgi:hypothetical protein